MKVLISVCFLLFLASCDPDVAGEKITLPPMNFLVDLNIDTTRLSIGDTLNLRTSLNTNYAGGNIVLNEGQPLLNAYIGYFKNISYPITNVDSVEQAIDGNHYKLFLSKGSIKFNSNKPLVLGFIPNIYNDSFVFDTKIVFNKKGLFAIELSQGFYESSQGKARTNSKFSSTNLNWQYYNFPNSQNPTPNDESYYRRYTIAITD
jgi:hypothetical protein